MPKTKLIKIIAWLVCLSVLTLFVLAEIGLARTQTLETDFTDGNRSFSALGSPTRIGAVDRINGRSALVGEPVYFDVRLPALAEETVVFVSWKKDPGLPDPALGVVLGKWDEPAPEFALHRLTAIGTEDQSTLSRVTLDLRGVPRRDGAYRLFLSVPGVSSEKTFTLHRVRIEAKRPDFEILFWRLWLTSYRLRNIL